MSTESTTARIYERHIGSPRTDDEVRGYWMFVVGLVAGVIGIVLFLPSGPASFLREWSIVFGGLGLALLVTGPVVRLPLRRLANVAAYLGLLICLLAIGWFIVVFPSGWSVRTGNAGVITLYALGIAVIGLGGVVIPLLTEATGAVDARTAELEAELAAERERRERLEAELAEARETSDEERGRLEAELAALRHSQGRFELYEDASERWRWRLRHRNGNVVATSGQGYTRKHNAQKGLHSVRSNAFGATILQVGDEADLPEADEEFEPVEEAESRATFELREDNAGEYRWRLVHDNGNLLADSGEGYESRDGAHDALDAVKEYVGPADYLRFDPTGFEVYRDQAGEYRWRLVHRNGNVLADGGEGYASRSNARRAVNRLRDDVDAYDFEVYEDAAGEYRWRLESPNGRIVADSGEGYTERDEAEDAVERVREYVPEADTLEVGRAAFEIYEDRGGEWRWRLRHRNGNILADSGEGYSDRSGAVDGIESVKFNAPNAGVE
ncbi:MAG: HVO_2922 family protein [Haloferacaceae archaeon]